MKAYCERQVGLEDPWWSTSLSRQFETLQVYNDVLIHNMGFYELVLCSDWWILDFVNFFIYFFWCTSFLWWLTLFRRTSLHQEQKYNTNADIWNQRWGTHNRSIHFQMSNTWCSESAESHTTAVTDWSKFQRRILDVCPQFMTLDICYCCVYIVNALGGLLLFYFKIMFGFTQHLFF